MNRGGVKSAKGGSSTAGPKDRRPRTLSEFVRSPPEVKQPIYERAARAPVEPHGKGCDEACVYYGTPHVVCIRVRIP